jgi:hypothetical protein
MLSDKLSETILPAVTQEYGPENLILYALGLGYGENRLDREELRFVYERDIETVPSICSVLCRSGAWMRDPELIELRARVVERNATVLEGRSAIFLTSNACEEQ